MESRDAALFYVEGESVGDLAVRCDSLLVYQLAPDFYFFSGVLRLEGERKGALIVDSYQRSGFANNKTGFGAIAHRFVGELLDSFEHKGPCPSDQIQ